MFGVGFPFLWFGFPVPKLNPNIIPGVGFPFLRRFKPYILNLCVGFPFLWFGFSLPKINPNIIPGVGFSVFLVGLHYHSGRTLARGAAFGRARVCLGVGVRMTCEPLRCAR